MPKLFPLLLILTLGCAQHSAPLLPPQIIELNLNPKFITASAFQNLNITIHTPNAQLGQQLCVEVEGGEFFSSSCTPLLALLNLYSLRLGADGAYEVRIYLYGLDGILQAQAKDTLQVGAQEVDETPPGVEFNLTY